MKRATDIVAGIITFAACAMLEIRIPTIQPAERGTDPSSSGERIKILESRPIPIPPRTTFEDRCMLIGTTPAKCYPAPQTPDRLFMLIGQTATDAPFLANPVETREITLQCGPQYSWTVHLNLTTNVAYFGAAYHGYGFRPNRSYVGLERQYIVFQTDPVETMRIDLMAMVYKLTRERGHGEWPSVTVGTCREKP